MNKDEIIEELKKENEILKENSIYHEKMFNHYKRLYNDYSNYYNAEFKRNEKLELELEQQQKIIDDLNIKIEQNNRGAGRKPRFDTAEKELIKMYSFQGHSIKDLAVMFKCSTGLIHKILHE